MSTHACSLQRRVDLDKVNTAADVLAIVEDNPDGQ